jgi:hypothetical protein
MGLLGQESELVDPGRADIVDYVDDKFITGEVIAKEDVA